MENDAFERAARKELVAGARLGFRIHLFAYLAVQALLAATWYLTSNGDAMPWFVFPLLGWGIGLGAHYLAMRASVARAQRPGA